MSRLQSKQLMFDLNNSHAMLIDIAEALNHIGNR
jgi:hypothetical protein